MHAPVAAPRPHASSDPFAPAAGCWQRNRTTVAVPSRNTNSYRLAAGAPDTARSGFAVGAQPGEHPGAAAMSQGVFQPVGKLI